MSSNPAANGTTPPGPDAWATAADGYDRYAFYVTSSDSKHRTTSMRVGVPPAVATQISQIVQSGKIPEYRTGQDVIRDAIYHRLYDLAGYISDPRLEGFVTLQMRTAEREIQRAEMEGLEDYVEWTRELLEKARGAGDVDVIRAVVEDQREFALGVRQPYRAQLEALFSEYEGAG